MEKISSKKDHLWRKGHLDPSLQNVVGGDLDRAGQLQVLHYQVGRHLREHLLNLVGLLIRRYMRKNKNKSKNFKSAEGISVYNFVYFSQIVSNRCFCKPFLNTG